MVKAVLGSKGQGAASSFRPTTLAVGSHVLLQVCEEFVRLLCGHSIFPGFTEAGATNNARAGACKMAQSAVVR